MLTPFVLLSVGILILWCMISIKNKSNSKIQPKPKVEDDRGYNNPKNTHITYLYMHPKTGELKVLTFKRHDNTMSKHFPLQKKGYEVLDVWWEDPSENK